MPDAYIAQQSRQIPRHENIPEQAISFFEVKPVLKACGDTGGILAAMLKHGKAFIENRANCTMPEDANYTAHNSSLPG
jgi:hypothetical protein